MGYSGAGKVLSPGRSAVKAAVLTSIPDTPFVTPQGECEGSGIDVGTLGDTRRQVVVAGGRPEAGAYASRVATAEQESRTSGCGAGSETHPLAPRVENRQLYRAYLLKEGLRLSLSTTKRSSWPAKACRLWPVGSAA